MTQIIPRTGWPPGLLQDDDRTFFRWLAVRACCACWRKAAREVK